MFRQTSERNRTRSFRAAMIVLAAIALVWSWRKWSEPRYHGRGIRSWIEQLPYDNSGNSEAQEAMRYFGTRAVPYLIDAMTRGAKWESGLLAKIPKDYISYLFDVSHHQQVRLHATGKLEELAVDEALENELQLNPKSPVLNQIQPVWWREVKQDPLNLFTSLFGLAPLMTNLAPLLRGPFEKMNPETTPHWIGVASVLAETHDPTLAPIFLRFATPTNSLWQRQFVFRLLARNGFSNEGVASALREALTSTNVYFRGSALAGCAYLNICSKEALAAIRERREVAPEIGRTELENIETYEPIIRWRANSNDVQAAEAIMRNLLPDKYPYRLGTADILAKIGPPANTFVPTLVRIAREEGPPFQTDALRALKSIAPDEARRVLASLPARKGLHATSARVSK